jgi:pimeloyl-ACP methyl ester carboxylesterase
MPDASSETVQSFLHANVVPARRAEPRLAPALASTEKQLVPSPQGVLAAWRLGDGPAVLLVHGWEDDNSLWAPLIDALVGRERAVVVFDLPAHGFSEGEWGLGPQAADGIAAVVTAMEPIDAVVAHSFAAGGVMLAMSEGALAVDRMALVAPPLGTGNRWLRYAERLGVSDDVAFAAQGIYEERIGPDRASFDFRAALVDLDVDSGSTRRRRASRRRLIGSRPDLPPCGACRRRRVEPSQDRPRPAVVARVVEFVI